jgi:anti-sigma B factor antagonist
MATIFRVSACRGDPSARPGESLIVTISGELDIATVPGFAARFDEFLASGLPHIVIDVSKLTFIDVAGFRALTVLRDQAEQQLVAFRLSGASAQMRRLMWIIGSAREFRSSDRTAEVAAEGEA